MKNNNSAVWFDMWGVPVRGAEVRISQREMSFRGGVAEMVSAAAAALREKLNMAVYGPGCVAYGKAA